MSQGLEHFLAKKYSCPEGGCGQGLISHAMQVAYINIMHCSLPVCSPCCQKEALKACTRLYSQAARHSGILPPSANGHFLAHSKLYIGTTVVCNEQSRFELPHCHLIIFSCFFLYSIKKVQNTMLEPKYFCQLYRYNKRTPCCNLTKGLTSMQKTRIRNYRNKTYCLRLEVIKNLLANYPLKQKEFMT